MGALRAGSTNYSLPVSDELVDSEILNLMKYFSLFRHPLKLSEIYKLLPDNITELSVKLALRKMDISGTIRKIDEYYLLAADDDAIIEKRIVGEAKATYLFPKAKRTAHFISLFPFVKFVGISGSLSKNYADENTDFDFFIITANNTLWICRTILHLVKKLSFLIGRQHHLCMNYFIDEHYLRLDEKNLFTRIELSTLIPVYNESIYKTFLLRNQSNLSNIQHLDVDFEGAVQFNMRMLGKKNLFLKSLNLFLMDLTDKMWKHKWRKRGFPMEDYQLAFKTTPYVSKNHPANYQKKVLEQLQKK
ncbi:hypothetical protein SAMN05518672_11535 [Chitinophaga sp. CF118]|uniref:hypothetical protein n=1 Tax=Chitinophaga sp. CF118 TaxID=1884367 RepID=UPI0008ED87E9|nr:hypothetical protein [Chitinophaga sp. CF118]SFF06529.1 hypothetical protein SAMN05518672_11535 [Chitinophaga sp. CF118]